MNKPIGKTYSVIELEVPVNLIDFERNDGDSMLVKIKVETGPPIDVMPIHNQFISDGYKNNEAEQIVGAMLDAAHEEQKRIAVCRYIV